MRGIFTFSNKDGSISNVVMARSKSEVRSFLAKMYPGCEFEIELHNIPSKVVERESFWKRALQFVKGW